MLPELMMLAKERQQRFLEEAQCYRMLKELKKSHPSLLKTFISKCGVFFIKIGMRLNKEYIKEYLPVHPQPEEKI